MARAGASAPTATPPGLRTGCSSRPRARTLRAEISDDGTIERAAAHERLRAGDSDAQALAGGLATLSPEHRAVIVLRHLLEYTPGEIAELLELPRGTVNSRLRRGLDALREAIGEELR